MMRTIAGENKWMQMRKYGIFHFAVISWHLMLFKSHSNNAVIKSLVHGRHVLRIRWGMWESSDGFLIIHHTILVAIANSDSTQWVFFLISKFIILLWWHSSETPRNMLSNHANSALRVRLFIQIASFYYFSNAIVRLEFIVDVNKPKHCRIHLIEIRIRVKKPRH